MTENKRSMKITVEIDGIINNIISGINTENKVELQIGMNNFLETNTKIHMQESLKNRNNA